jgi:transposase
MIILQPVSSSESSSQKSMIIGCELNPIELIWAQVKGFVAKNNTTFPLKDAKELTYAAFGKITKHIDLNVTCFRFSYFFPLSIILNMIIL